ncbi:hypothetical protein E2320_017933 [Naja naja]|nr:hypothetical protein E2320_017933 [Naja naja]
MERELQLGSWETEVASKGLVGSTLMGKSQLKVSTSICSTPVQLGHKLEVEPPLEGHCGRQAGTQGEGSQAGPPPEGQRGCAGSPTLVLNPGAELSGMGRLKLVRAVCRQDSWCRAWVLYEAVWALWRWKASCTRSSVCKLTRYWRESSPSAQVGPPQPPQVAPGPPHLQARGVPLGEAEGPHHVFPNLVDGLEDAEGGHSALGAADAEQVCGRGALP